MKKKNIKIIIGILLLGIFSFLGYKIAGTLQHKEEVAKRIQTLPKFSFYTLKGKKFTQNNLVSKPTIFVYFNSDCDFCQSEATKIQEHLSEFDLTQLIFVSFEQKEAIQKFARQYQLDNKQNVTFLEDREGAFSQLFDVNSIPYIVVYDKNRKLLQKFKGVTKIASVLSVLK